jgi:hypothetical protein
MYNSKALIATKLIKNIEKRYTETFRSYVGIQVYKYLDNGKNFQFKFM